MTDTTSVLVPLGATDETGCVVMDAVQLLRPPGSFTGVAIVRAAVPVLRIV
jgi:hypothetical protein